MDDNGIVNPAWHKPFRLPACFPLLRHPSIMTSLTLAAGTQCAYPLRWQTGLWTLPGASSTSSYPTSISTQTTWKALTLGSKCILKEVSKGESGTTPFWVLFIFFFTSHFIGLNLKFSGFSPENKNMGIYNYLLGLRSRFSSKGQHGWSSQPSEVGVGGWVWVSSLAFTQPSGKWWCQRLGLEGCVHRAGPSPWGWKVIDTSIPFVTQPPEHSSFTHWV